MSGENCPFSSSNGVLTISIGFRSVPLIGKAHKSRPVFGSVSLYKRNWPLLDQSCAYVFFGVSNSNSSALAPLADFTYRLNGPLLNDENAIRVPSGDQSGAISPPPLRYATRPSAEIEKLLKPVTPTSLELTGSASRTGSPTNSPRFRSKRWAISAVWRTKAIIPGARYAPVLLAAANRFGSPPSSDPR